MGNQSETGEVENANEEQTLKKGRHRKKQLYNSILQQMEFYFSDSNLTKDRFLSQLLKESRYIDLDVFLKFNKIKKLTSSVEDIQKAVKHSNLIELSEDKKGICRKEPVKEKLNIDECTIYVERLKSDATHEWLTSVFSEFGNVVYVSIPRYKHNNVIKGFAFIEFDKESEAEKAVSYFESIDCKMPLNTEPDQLCSIATFEASNDQETVNKNSNDTESVNRSDENRPKKRKFSDTEDNENEDNVKKAKTDGGEVSESEDSENRKKKKLKKEQKKKIYIKELGLQVLPKKEWKRMRNRYLELQRKKMKDFKQHLFRAKYGQAQYGGKTKKKDNEKSNEKSAILKDSTDQKCDKKEVSAISESNEGLIVKIKLTEPISDPKKLKADLKSSSADIMYVDIPNIGTDAIYVRFNEKNNAANFCKRELLGSKEVLVGEEEKLYWDKIKTSREVKHNHPRNKQRGRDKLLKKAKHTKFDE